MRKIVILGVGIIILLITFIVLYFSPLGSFFLKNYIKNKLCFAQKFKVSYFNHSLNSFSMALNNKDGTIQIFGTIIPFNASYNANFNNIQTLTYFLKGQFNSTGEIYMKKNLSKIKGNYLYSKGYGRFNINCNKIKLFGQIKGYNFNTKVFLQNIKNFKFPIFNKIPIKGKNDLIVILSNPSKLKADFSGEMNINNITFPIKSNLTMDFLNLDMFNFILNTISSEFKGKITGSKRKKDLTINGNLNNFNLKLVRKNILYPVKGMVNLSFKYNNLSNIFNFSSKFFNGYSDGKHINIQINSSLKDFFKFLDIPPILKGHISGNIVIYNNKGYFNFLIENAFFVRNKVIKKLDKLLHLKLENVKSIFFLNGKFDDQKVIFDFISKNYKYYMYLTKGIYYYNEFYNINFDLSIGNNFYKFNITNNHIKLIQHTYEGMRYEILVY